MSTLFFSRARFAGCGARALPVVAVAVATLGLLVPTRALADFAPIAPLTDRVMDEAHLLSPGQVVRLRQQLAALERSRKVQFVVSILETLDGEPIEDRALRMGEAYRLGRKGIDDGLLLVVARQERQVRFEVGYGLESELSDVVASRLIDATRAAHPNGPDGEGVLELASQAAQLLEARLPPPAVRRALVEPLIDRTVGLGLLAALGVGSLVWLTWGRRRMDSLPFRPLRPPPRAQAGHAGSFRNSLWYSVLIGWLLGGRGGRGSRRGGDGGGLGGDDRDGPPRGGGGGFGGGGASGRW